MWWWTASSSQKKREVKKKIGKFQCYEGVERVLDVVFVS